MHLHYTLLIGIVFLVGMTLQDSETGEFPGGPAPMTGNSLDYENDYDDDDEDYEDYLSAAQEARNPRPRGPTDPPPPGNTPSAAVDPVSTSVKTGGKANNSKPTNSTATTTSQHKPRTEGGNKRPHTAVTVNNATQPKSSVSSSGTPAKPSAAAETKSTPDISSSDSKTSVDHRLSHQSTATGSAAGVCKGLRLQFSTFQGELRYLASKLEATERILQAAETSAADDDQQVERSVHTLRKSLLKTQHKIDAGNSQILAELATLLREQRVTQRNIVGEIAKLKRHLREGAALNHRALGRLTGDRRVFPQRPPP